MARRSPLLPLLLAVVGLYWFAPVPVDEWTPFVAGAGGLKKPAGLARVALKASAATDYPELSRVEDIIYESCIIKDGSEALECLRLYDNLQKFHGEAKAECSLDDLRCIVLDVLDRLCLNIKGKDGLVLLSKVATTMETFREKFSNWEEAFKDVDTDDSGELSLAELTAAIKKFNISMTDNEIGMVFTAADANGDGSVSKEEFSNFMTAAVFAEEPLRAMQPDALPKGQPSFEEYLKWSAMARA